MGKRVTVKWQAKRPGAPVNAAINVRPETAGMMQRAMAKAAVKHGIDLRISAHEQPGSFPERTKAKVGTIGSESAAGKGKSSTGYSRAFADRFDSIFRKKNN